MKTKVSLVVSGLALVLGFGLVGVLGCGGSDDDSGLVSLPGDKTRKISEVTEAEMLEGCQSFQAAILDSMSDDTLCRMAAVMATVDYGIEDEEGGAVTGDDPQVSCESVYQMCKANPQMVQSMKGEWDDEFDCGDDMDVPENCDATVAEVEACINSQVTLMRDAFKKASCSNADALLKAMDDFEEANTAACKALEVKCPGFFSGDVQEPTRWEEEE
jgi:hypothetical protein